MKIKRTNNLKDKANESQLTFLHRPMLHQPWQHSGIIENVFQRYFCIVNIVQNQVKTSIDKMNFLKPLYNIKHYL